MAQLPDDVRRQLRDWCGDQGLLTELRAFLRHRLVELVTRSAPPCGAPTAAPAEREAKPLLLLTADLLRHLRLWYTHTVLSAEAGLAPRQTPADALLSAADVHRVAAELGVDSAGLLDRYSGSGQPLVLLLMERAGRRGGDPQRDREAEPLATELQLLQTRRRAEQQARQLSEQQLQQQARQHREQLQQQRQRSRRRCQARLAEQQQQHEDELEAASRQLRAERCELIAEVQRERARLRKRSALLDDREECVERREKWLEGGRATGRQNDSAAERNVQLRDSESQTEAVSGESGCTRDRACQTSQDAHAETSRPRLFGTRIEAFHGDDEGVGGFKIPVPPPVSPWRNSVTELVKTTLDSVNAQRQTSPLQTQKASLIRQPSGAGVALSPSLTGVTEKTRVHRPAHLSPAQPVPQRIISSLERRVADLETSLAQSPLRSPGVRPVPEQAANQPVPASTWEPPDWRERQRAALDALLVTTDGLESQVRALQQTAVQLQLQPPPSVPLQRPEATSAAPPPLPPPPPPCLPPPPARAVSSEPGSQLSSTRGRLAALSVAAAELHRQFGRYQSEVGRPGRQTSVDSVRRQLFQADGTAVPPLGVVDATKTPERGVWPASTPQSREDRVEEVLRRSREAAMLSPGLTAAGKARSRTRGSLHIKDVRVVTPKKEDTPGSQHTSRDVHTSSPYRTRAIEPDGYREAAAPSSAIGSRSVRFHSGAASVLSAAVTDAGAAISPVKDASGEGSSVPLAAAVEGSSVALAAAVEGAGPDWCTLGAVGSSPSRLRRLLRDPVEPGSNATRGNVRLDSGKHAASEFDFQPPQWKQHDAVKSPVLDVSVSGPIGHPNVSVAVTQSADSDPAEPAAVVPARQTPFLTGVDLDSRWKTRSEPDPKPQSDPSLAGDSGEAVHGGLTGSVAKSSEGTLAQLVKPVAAGEISASALVVDLEAAWRPRKDRTPSRSPESVDNDDAAPDGAVTSRSSGEASQPEEKRDGDGGPSVDTSHSGKEEEDGGSAESLPARPRLGGGDSAVSAERSGALLRSVSGYSGDPTDAPERASPAGNDPEEKAPPLSMDQIVEFPFPSSESPRAQLSVAASPSPPSSGRRAGESQTGSDGRRWEGEARKPARREVSRGGSQSSSEEISAAVAGSGGDSDEW